MAEFMLKNNFFEVETAIETKFAPPYARLFINIIENDFLHSEIVKPWLWLRYIDNIFFIWTEGEYKT